MEDTLVFPSGCYDSASSYGSGGMWLSTVAPLPCETKRVSYFNGFIILWVIFGLVRITRLWYNLGLAVKLRIFMRLFKSIKGICGKKIIDKQLVLLIVVWISTHQVT